MLASRSGFRADFRPDYSGATAPDFHRLPLDIAATFGQAAMPVNRKGGQAAAVSLLGRRSGGKTAIYACWN
ncbi:hypothetical protein KL86PLE_90437 [uncultured Pleomorphomonas sp.]|uniref:Uncharacterized protein n=1 Tax=uncultured Pleomorphomonas sp. TaxID=442121 RepID=A0A212LPM2_9HYPH|nr:hypothetical protein KL86PLE_90437 [uncultured Pleomorphomonas sp.]